MRRRPDEIDKMRKAGRVVAEMLSGHLGCRTPWGHHGAARQIGARGARAARRALQLPRLPRFPRRHLRLPQQRNSPWDPWAYVLKEGDIISIDCGAIIQGYHGDAAVTVAVGDVPALTEKLLRVTEESLVAGLGQLVEGNRLHDVGLAVQTVAEGAGFSVVRGYVGHAIGTEMHEEPAVPNYWPGSPGPKLRTGMVFAVEPMVNVGAAETVLLDDGWTVITADGSLSAHFEHTIAVTDNGPEILTVPG